MWKKLLTVLLIVCTAACILTLNRYQQASVEAVINETATVNATLEELAAERDALEGRLEELMAAETNPGEAEEQTAQPDGTVEQQSQPVLLCLNALGKETYSELYPRLTEAGVTGVLILREGRLPGDNRMLSVQEFLEMVDSGWSFAISLESSSDADSDDWQGEVEDYIDRLQRRVGLTPELYCFPEGGCSENEIQFLQEQGIHTVLTHQPVELYGQVRAITLFPYRMQTLQEDIFGLNGYCGLEMWVNWPDETDLALRYSEQGLTELLSDTSLQLLGLEELQPVQESPLPESEDIEEEEPETDKQIDEIRNRLADIQAEMDALYR